MGRQFNLTNLLVGLSPVMMVAYFAAILLKAFGIITVSWWWVALSPFWVPFVLLLGLICVLGIAVLVCMATAWRNRPSAVEDFINGAEKRG